MWAMPSVLNQQGVQCIDGKGKQTHAFIFKKETEIHGEV
jgi:hypothetical protein